MKWPSWLSPRLALLAIGLGMTLGVVGAHQVLAAGPDSGPTNFNYQAPDGTCYPPLPSRGPHIQADGYGAFRPYDPTLYLGRLLNDGYFTNSNTVAQPCVDGNQTVWPKLYTYHGAGAGVDPAADGPVGDPAAAAALISQVGANLNADLSCTTNGQYNTPACFDQRRLVYGAAFIIDSMMHKANNVPYGGFPADTLQAGIAKAQYEFFAWSQYITSLNNANRIIWDENLSVGWHFNSTSTGYGAPASDVTLFWAPPETSEFIHFVVDPSDPTKDIYLNRFCANIVGDANAFIAPVYTIQPTLAVGSDILAGNIVEPGNTYHLTPGAINTSSFQTDGYTLDVNDLNAAGAVGNGNPPNTGPYGVGTGYQVGGCKSGAARCWYDTNSAGLSPAASASKPDGVGFTVPAGAPEGQVLCFSATIWWYTETPGTVSPPSAQVCVTVHYPHYPGINGLSGDVHAGGNVCGAVAGSPAFINTHSQNDSLTEYVLSATGTIAGFGSNNSASGGTNATLGHSGNYADICRPDLVNTALAYVTTHTPGVDYATLPGGTWDVGSVAFNALPGAGTGIYLHNGGAADLTLKGTFNRKITIVSLTGNVIIANPVQLSALATAGVNAPSLGIISANDIVIKGAATRVDAYLFADGTIDTCAEGNNPACGNTLVVNGFLMSKAIVFHRLGPSVGAAATVGERINLTGQIYLNPPKFFDNAASLNLLQNQGEKPPLN